MWHAGTRKIRLTGCTQHRISKRDLGESVRKYYDNTHPFRGAFCAGVINFVFVLYDFFAGSERRIGVVFRMTPTRCWTIPRARGGK